MACQMYVRIYMYIRTRTYVHTYTYAKKYTYLCTITRTFGWFNITFTTSLVPKPRRGGGKVAWYLLQAHAQKSHYIYRKTVHGMTTLHVFMHENSIRSSMLRWLAHAHAIGTCTRPLLLLPPPPPSCLGMRLVYNVLRYVLILLHLVCHTHAFTLVVVL